MPEILVDFISSLDGYGAAEDWPGWWGLEGPEYLAWLGEQPEADYTILMGCDLPRHVLEPTPSMPDEATDWSPKPRPIPRDHSLGQLVRERHSAIDDDVCELCWFIARHVPELVIKPSVPPLQDRRFGAHRCVPGHAPLDAHLPGGFYENCETQELAELSAQ
jgi:hypothetical protein